MKTTILTATVLMALSISAFGAETKKASVRDEVLEQASEMVELNSDSKKSEGRKADDEKSKKQTTAKTQSTSHKVGNESGDLTIVRLDNGETYAKFIPDSCQSRNCAKVVVLDDKSVSDMNNIDDLAKEFDKLIAESAKKDKEMKDKLAGDKKSTPPAKKESSDADKAVAKIEQDIARNRDDDRDSRKRRGDRDFNSATNSVKKEIQEELVSLMEECGDTNDAGRSSVDLSKTRFSGISAPMSNNKVSCRAERLKDFMEDHAEMVDLKEQREESNEIQRELNVLKNQERKYKSAISRAESDEVREKLEVSLRRLQQKIERTEDDLKETRAFIKDAERSQKAYKEVTTSVAKKMIIDPAVQDLASKPQISAKDLTLHNLALNAPEEFSGVKAAAKEGVFDVLRLQAQTHLGLLEKANQTQDPALKAQYTAQAQMYKNSAIGYDNLMKSNPGFQSIWNSHGSDVTQIMTYLNQPNLTGALGQNRVGTQNIPQVLLVNSDGTVSVVQGGLSTTDSANARGNNRTLPTTPLNGSNLNQNIRLAQPVTSLPTNVQQGNALPFNPNGGMNNGAVNMNNGMNNGFNNGMMNNGQSFVPPQQFNGFQPNTVAPRSRQ